MTTEQLALAREFLLKEYENAAQVTFHADEFRDKLSTFFLTFAGAAVALVGLMLQGLFTQEIFGDKNLTAALFLMGVSIVGVIILCIHARLRRVQLEHFAMINRIRLYCLQDELAVWNAIRLSSATLPKIKLTNWSGSELWALTILLPATVLLATGVDFILRWNGMGGMCHWISVCIGMVLVFVLWRLYATLATPPEHAEIETNQVNTWLDDSKVRVP